jgi:flavin reductase (DIM6/NTAB) family NADH-FMN oxidoreductase RutF
MELDPQTLSGLRRYQLLTSAVVPRPIALVTSQDKLGVVNLAPFSYFNLVTTNPVMISISIGQRMWQGQRIDKDTVRNVEATGEFVVNIAGEQLLHQLNDSAAEHAPGVSELDSVGLTTEASVAVSAPRVAECPVHLECRLHQIVRLVAGQALVLGTVVHIHVSEDVWDERANDIDPEKLRPLARLGRTYYAKLGSLVDVPRPKLG